ncbi:hypothetical protein [Zavarzinia sp.]|jgi:hypothetical protein|uniref:hypothetical protein n=1 Tax=Zavarzinia sp. TaxID=2027920 RepID=UPI003562684A
MFDLKQLEIDLRPRTSYWLGDPDIDQATADHQAWRERGEGLEPIPQGKPAGWLWRPLDECERDAVLLAEGRRTTDELDGMRLTVAYGLLAIDGVALRRRSDTIPSRLVTQALSIVARIGEKYPARVPRVNPETGAPEVNPGTGEPVMDVIPALTWISGLIYGATFQRGG